MNAVAAVVFTYADKWRSFLPLCLCSGSSNKLVCFLLPKTKAYRSFFAKVSKNHTEISFFQERDVTYYQKIFPVAPKVMLERHLYNKLLVPLDRRISLT